MIKNEICLWFRFFPSSHSMEVISNPISGITFSQLKATVTGKVRCLREKDCASLKVVIQSPDNKDVVADIIGNECVIQHIRV